MTLLLALALGAGVGDTVAIAASQPEPSVPVAAASSLELRIDPLVDLYFFVRAQAADLSGAPLAGYLARALPATWPFDLDPR